MEFNGWTNYETWLASLYLDNDYYSDRAQDLARESIEQGYEDAEAVRRAMVRNLAQEMEADLGDGRPETEGLYADLLTAAMKKINWHEIACHFAADLTFWSAGWNMPGYMPDSDPAIFVDHADARTYIVDEMRRDAENAETEEEAEEIESAAEHAESDACRGEYGVTVGKYHYWITKV